MVDVKLAPAGGARPRLRGRWLVIVTVLGVVAVVVAAMVVTWWKPSGDVRPVWQPPAQTFLASSMRMRPVPGWRTSVLDLGLPAAAPGAVGRSTIAASYKPSQGRAFVGNIGDRAYFLATTSGAPLPQWWLVGLDVRDGHRLFAPIRLDTSITSPPECFLNGTTTVLCLRNDARTAAAWVIDTASGAVSFAGPTSLRTFPGKLRVVQVGIYAVAETMDEGVSGVGARAEPTWFVPGDGSVGAKQLANPDVGPQTHATQIGVGRGSLRMAIFSVADGTVISLDLGKDAHQQMTDIYPGGFAAEIAFGGNPDTQVEFFDNNGTRTAWHSIKGDLSMGSSDVPIVHTHHNNSAFTPNGHKLIDIPLEHPIQAARLVGSKLFVTTDTGSWRWQQYDLQTGVKGKECQFEMSSHYLGSDGSVAVFMVDDPDSGFSATANDLATCEVLWKIPSEVRSSGRVWRVNTTLIQLSDDGTEVFSLVAPRQ